MSVTQNNSTLECDGVISEPRALMRVRFRTNDPGEDRSTQRVMRVWISAGASTRSNYAQQVTDKSVDVRLLHVRVVVAACSALGISRGIRHLLLDAASFLHPSLLGQIKE